MTNSADLAIGSNGCSTAANPSLTPVTLSSAPGDNRLVVIILRGGMDGLSAVQPYGDPNYLKMRGKLAKEDGRYAQKLDGFFALHPALAPLLGLWEKEELGFVHSVSTPYRDKRSHFEGQDLLEAGSASFKGGKMRDGWLNRMMQGMSDVTGETAFALGRQALPILSGDIPVSRWAPAAGLMLQPQARDICRQMMHGYPQFSQAFEDALRLSGDLDRDATSTGCDTLEDMQTALENQIKQGRDGDAIASFAASRLLLGTRIAAFSISGWDTHANQSAVLSRMLAQLASCILTLKRDLGSVWKKTSVVALTEFGRTLRINGTNGTDHGTGGVMMLAGGAIRGRRVVGTWPGLDEASLYDRRDLNPTSDVRMHLAWIMRGLFGFDQSFLRDTVFPGLEMHSDPMLLR
ncbi:DUF1501 domain-containing protein [Pseudorhodobacter sp. E13]|uniref:DUF1501 domain-containing protein n=1 Tax=Pseudorhodobacter sp. E13 TaxID=2487931 RepID=UPI000F8D0AD7|nr:DUF1501 domain-containing protein [Pseudorhodobacter sp. E13]RUS65021.1 DUF1501 domain-containing protein [Pseudorhodobacter sp. E13]